MHRDSIHLAVGASSRAWRRHLSAGAGSARRVLGTLALVLTAMACGCVTPHTYNLPPAERLLEPGPGVGGPGPGVLPPAFPFPPPSMIHTPQANVQILFSEANQMESMQIQWDVTGVGMFDSEPLVVPGRVNFGQGGIYRLKLTSIPGREGLELYPTLEIAPITPRTEAYLAHNAIPIQFTNEDFDQVESNNFVTKVIYLPDPEFQELAQAGIETLVSTRLDPGVDPIVEADRRGAIMAVVRLGNKDVEMPGAGGGGYVGPDGIIHASHHDPLAGGMVGPVPLAMNPAALSYTGLMPNYVSGITSPQYGMPYSGTPIGLPGPPHLPFGAPAGLHTHVMRNRTRMYLPEPVGRLSINVKQNPGFSYPRPVHHINVYEQNIHAPQHGGQPHWNKNFHVR